jgi:ABC-type transporter Mla subunit MlaD
MTATITVKSSFLKFIRQDSATSIRKAVIGEAYVEIKRGTGPPLSETDPTLPDVKPDVAATELAETLLRDLREKMLPAVDQVREAAREYTELAKDLRNPDGDLKQAIVRMNRIADAAENGDGVVARLLTDRALADQIVATGPKVNAALDETNATLRNLNKTSAALPEMTATVNDQLKLLPGLVKQMEGTAAELQVVLRDVQRATAQLPQTIKSVNRTVDGLPALVVQAQETLRQTQRTVEGLQRSWLVRGGVEPDAPAGRIGADRVGGGGGGR